MKLNVISVFLIVIAAGAVGMLLGGAFGHWCGRSAPELLDRLLWGPMRHGHIEALSDPVGVGMVLGAINGLFIGMGLGVFGILIQVAVQAIRKWKSTPKGLEP